MKKGLLFLAHRMPYPPNKGDKIRSYHLLRHLAADYRIYLGCLVDDPADWQYTGALDELCEEVKAVALNPLLGRLKGIGSIATGRPLSLDYFWNSQLAAWVDDLIRANRVAAALAFSSPMARYLETHDAIGRVMDFVDVDSDKWRQYAEEANGPLAWVYRREHTTLERYERKIAAQFDASVVVTEAEAELLRQLAPEAARRIHAVANGVDQAYFDPGLVFADPFTAGRKPIVFTGAMDYRANVDAVSWFAQEVFPTIHHSDPTAEFWIVGSNPTDAVKRLADADAVRVTGRVADVRPYLSHAQAIVAPLRVARGVQNKVLEALAMEKPVVCTPEAAEGLAGDAPIQVTADPAAMSRMVASVLDRTRDAPGSQGAGGRYIRQHYEWSVNLSRMSDLIETAAVAAAGQAAGGKTGIAA